MAKPGGILGQIGESFEQIGQDVARETVQAPKDIVGKALESLGGSSGKKTQSQQTPSRQQGQEGTNSQPDTAQSEEIKKAVARAALEEISGKRPKQREKSVWEKLQEEEEQKKLEKKKRDEAKKASLPQMSSKRKRGDLYGTKAKKTQVENRNVRQD